MGRRLGVGVWLWGGLLVAAAILGLTVAIFVVTLIEHDFVEAANVSGPWFAGLIALVIAILTAMYVADTRDMAQATVQLADETRRTREEMSAPVVVPFFSFERRLLSINLKNIGAGIALDVQAEFQPPIPSRRGAIKYLPINEKPIPVFRPQEPFEHFVDVAPTFFASDANNPKLYVVRVSYKSSTGEETRKDYDLDLSIYEGMRLVDDEGMPELVKHVERITRIVERVTDLGGSIHIKTPRDVRRENRERRKAWAEEERNQRNGNRGFLGLGRLSRWFRRLP